MATETVKTLTAKQERFAAEYLVDMNATQAAIRAGYSEATANQQGARLLANVGVKRLVNVGKRKAAAKLELTAEKVLADIERISNKAEKSRQFNAAIRGKQLLGQHLKLFTEKHEHGGMGGGPVQFSITPAEASH